MQITQAKLVCIVNNDRIYIWNIHTAFNNIGTNQHIIFFINKIKNPFFQFMTFHLSMRIANTQIRTKTLYQSLSFQPSPCTRL